MPELQTDEIAKLLPVLNQNKAGIGFFLFLILVCFVILQFKREPFQSPQDH